MKQLFNCFVTPVEEEIDAEVEPVLQEGVLAAFQLNELVWNALYQKFGKYKIL